MWDTARQDRPRREAVAWLTLRTQDGALSISREDLSDFLFDGEPFALLDRQRGIRSPAGWGSALSIMTVWRPEGAVQPKGGRTLVNLPTYFEVTWPRAGVEPAEVASVTLLGRTVQIRPRVTTYGYAFGDGGSMGPTASRGGPYPSGDVVHAYVRPASTRARATARYSGDYSLDGGDTWGDVGLVVPVQGPESPVRVLEGRARLVAEVS